MRARVCGVGLASALALLMSVVVAGPSVAGDGGPWVWPVTGAVVRAFDPPETRYGPGHRGVDLAATVGTPVRAAGAGRISYAGLLAGRGVVVVVHGGLRTTYEPVAASVRVGQSVAAGTVLGRLTAGHCAAGCLHWGLLRGEVYLDPLQLVRRGPSRLLPVSPGAGPAAGVGAAARPRQSAAAAPTRPPPLQEVTEPAFSLRATELPWGVTALAALLIGLLLLATRPPRPPRGPRHHPPETALPAPPAPAGATERGNQAQLVDLGTERSRRRIA